MNINKKQVAITSLKIATGYHAISRTVGDSKQSWSRIKSLFSRTEGSKLADCESGAFKYRVYNPDAYQYGDVVKLENGEFQFIPDGSADSVDEAKKSGKTILRGAWFGGDDFPSLISASFTEEQINQMINGHEIRKTLFVIGFAMIVLLSLMFAAFGQFVGLLSLPMAVAIGTFAIKNGMQAEALKFKKLVDYREYFAKYGWFGWVTA